MDRRRRCCIRGPNPTTGLGTVPLRGVCTGSTQAKKVGWGCFHGSYIFFNTLARLLLLDLYAASSYIHPEYIPLHKGPVRYLALNSSASVVSFRSSEDASNSDRQRSRRISSPSLLPTLFNPLQPHSFPWFRWLARFLRNPLPKRNFSYSLDLTAL